MANPEREIRDMEELIGKLEDVIVDLNSVVIDDHINVMRNVVSEWSSTKECIVDLVGILDSNSIDYA